MLLVRDLLHGRRLVHRERASLVALDLELRILVACATNLVEELDIRDMYPGDAASDVTDI